MADETTISESPTPYTVKRRPNGAKIDYPLAATMLAAGMKHKEVAAKFGVKVESLYVGLSRKGICKGLAAVDELRAQRAEGAAINAMQRASERLRGKLSTELES